MYYYTYYSYEEWGRGYIGSRGSKVPPEQDTNYMGSYRDKTFKPTQKIIIASHYKTRQEALSDEIFLQRFFQVVPNSHFANRSYQTSTKFCTSLEDSIKYGRAGGKISGKISGKLTYEHGIGIFGLTEEQKKENASMGGKISGKLNLERKIGIHGLIKEQIIQNASKGGKIQGKIAYEQGIGIFGLTEEQRKKNSSKGGKIVGKRHVEQGTGWFKLTKEQRRENSSKGGKTLGTQRWQCTETGFITTPGALSSYQKKRSIDTTQRIRLS